MRNVEVMCQRPWRDSEYRSDNEPGSRLVCPLTEFAWAFRYPGDHPVPTVDEARQGLATAVRAVEGVVSCLPAEAVPPALLNPNL